MSDRLAEVLKRAQALTVQEQAELIEFLHSSDVSQRQAKDAAPKWSSLRGAAIPEQRGDDAQVWISRERQESDRRGTEERS